MAIRMISAGQAHQTRTCIMQISTHDGCFTKTHDPRDQKKGKEREKIILEKRVEGILGAF